MIKQGFRLMPIGNGTNIKMEINCMKETQLPNRCRGEPCVNNNMVYTLYKDIVYTFCLGSLCKA